MPPLEPHLWCADLAESLRFYERALSFSVSASYPLDTPPAWYQLIRGKVRLMIASSPSEEIARDAQACLREVRDRIGQPGPISLYLRSDDVDHDLRACTEFGARVVEPLWTPFWGGPQFTVADPDGILWTITAGDN